MVRDLRHLQIRKLSVGPMDNNAYLLTCRSTGAQLLIDAAADPDCAAPTWSPPVGSTTGWTSS